MASNKKVRLTKAFTWAGVNYAAGENELPEAAAAYAVRRKFGTTGSREAATQGEQNSETEEKTENEKETEEITGLPEDFPMRHVFDKAGFKSLAEVQAKSHAELTDIDGIGDKTADNALNYGK